MKAYYMQGRQAEHKNQETMAKTRILTSMIMAVAVLASCTGIALAPDFSRSLMPYEVPAEGGEYLVKVDYRSLTRSTYHYLEWEFRTVIDGKIVDQVNVPACKLEDFLTDDHFTVVIPANDTDHLRPILIETSYYNEHGREYRDSEGESYDGGWWTDWEPAVSSVQLKKQ